jgi:aconitate hydratase
MKQYLNSFGARQTLAIGGKTYAYYSLHAAEKNGLSSVSRLPFSLKVIIENMLRNEDGRSTSKADIEDAANWIQNKGSAEKEIAFRPARVLMQDFTGVPAVVDLAAMRDAMRTLGGDPQKINPLVPVDLVIDHSVIVDAFGNGQALAKNVELEYQRNGERYRFLKWGQGAFTNFRAVPPGTGICQQVAEPSWPIPILSSAPTPTPRWSMALPCSAGAWEESRPRPSCSVNKSRCCCRKSSASG